jgi:secreted PhoX family phosphatase
MYQGEFRNIGNNQMLACDPASGETRRFLTAPTNCEVTGVSFTPDGRTLFISIQHPGETPSERSDPADPDKYSNWPTTGPTGVRGRRRWSSARRMAV